MRYSKSDKDYCMEDPHKQLIETICCNVLPNMVRIYESKKMASALNQDHFVKLLEQKIEQANRSLKMLPVEDQCRYRAIINQAYEENIDRLRERAPVPKARPVQNIPVEFLAE